jgi:hypothetical protein
LSSVNGLLASPAPPALAADCASARVEVRRVAPLLLSLLRIAGAASSVPVARIRSGSGASPPGSASSAPKTRFGQSVVPSIQLPEQSESLIPVSRANRSRPSGTPPFDAAQRRVCSRVCCLRGGRYDARRLRSLAGPAARNAMS